MKRVTKKKKKMDASSRPRDTLPSGISVSDYFEPITLFANANLESGDPEVMEELMRKSWKPARQIVFDFPSWDYHKEALISGKEKPDMYYYMMTNKNKADKIFKNGVKEGRKLKSLTTKEMKELGQFQKTLKNKLSRLLRGKRPRGIKFVDWAEILIAWWCAEGPIKSELKFFPLSDTGKSFLDVVDSFPNFIKYLLAKAVSTKVAHRFKRCNQCSNYFFAKTEKPQEYCQKECRWEHHNQERTEDGSQKEYMRKARAEGKYQ